MPRMMPAQQHGGRYTPTPCGGCAAPQKRASRAWPSRGSPGSAPKDSTPAELAAVAGVDRSTVWRIEERGQGAHPSTAEKLADALGIQVEDLMGFRDAGSPPGGGRSTKERPLFGTALKEALQKADEQDGWRGQQKVLQEQMAKVEPDHPFHAVYEALDAELEVLEGKALAGAIPYERAAGRFYVSLPRAALRLMLEGKPVPAWLQKEAYRELAS